MKRAALFLAVFVLVGLSMRAAHASHHHKVTGSLPATRKTLPAPVLAQRKDDVLVWVDLNTGAYYLPGDHLWGATLSGEYMAESAADAAGYHEVQVGE